MEREGRGLAPAVVSFLDGSGFLWQKGASGFARLIKRKQRPLLTDVGTRASAFGAKQLTDRHR